MQRKSVQLSDYFVATNGDKGLNENLIEAMELQWTDKKEYKTRNESKLIAFFLEFSDNQGFEARIKSKDFKFPWSYTKHKNQSRRRRQNQCSFYRDIWSRTER